MGAGVITRWQDWLDTLELPCHGYPGGALNIWKDVKNEDVIVVFNVMETTTHSSAAPFAFPSLSNALLYLVLTLFWSWTFLLIVILRNDDAAQFSTWILRVISGLGPLVVAVGMMIRFQDGEGLRSFFSRSLMWQGIPPLVLTLSILLQPALALLSILTVRLVSGAFPTLSMPSSWLAQPLSLLQLVILTLFFGPLPEELGWRGYALPRLQFKWQPLFASLGLGLVWIMWHLPLFFISGTYQAELGFASSRFWVYNLNLMTHSILLTWLMNASGGATLTAILFHYMTNLSGEFLAVPTEVEFIWAGWALIAAFAVSFSWIWRRKKDDTIISHRP